MKLIVNGEDREFDDAVATVRQLLEHLQVPVDRTAVEVNQQIVVTEEYAGRQLNELDRIEIVSFVGGG